MPIGYQKEIDTKEQSQLEKIIRYCLMVEQKTDIALTSAIAVNDTTINVSAGHGFTNSVGERVVIFEGTHFVQLKINSINVNALTVDAPFDYAFTTAAKVIRGNIELNKDFTTQGRAQFRLYGEVVPIDLTEINVSMTHVSAGDDGKFGGIDSLTKAIVFRRDNNEITNYGTYYNNGDFRLSGYDIVYAAKGPGGIESTSCRLNLVKTFGKEIRIYNNDSFYLLLNSNLTGLSSFRICVSGSFTSGEY